MSTVTSTRRYISTCCIGVQSFEQVFRSQISTALALSSTSHKHLRTRLAKNAVSARGLKAFHYEKTPHSVAYVRKGGNVSTSQ